MLPPFIFTSLGGRRSSCVLASFFFPFFLSGRVSFALLLSLVLPSLRLWTTTTTTLLALLLLMTMIALRERFQGQAVGGGGVLLALRIGTEEEGTFRAALIKQIERKTWKRSCAREKDRVGRSELFCSTTLVSDSPSPPPLYLSFSANATFLFRSSLNSSLFLFISPLR